MFAVESLIFCQKYCQLFLINYVQNDCVLVVMIKEATSSSWVGLLPLGLIGVDVIQGSTLPFPAVVTDHRVSQIPRCYLHTHSCAVALANSDTLCFFIFIILRWKIILEVLANMF